MPLQYPWYSASFAVAAVLVVAATTQAWQFRHEPGGRPLVVTLTGLAFWASCEFVVTVVAGTELAFVFMKLWYIGVSVVVAGVFAFALDFTGYKQYLTHRTVGALAIWPIIFNAIVWLRPELVWSTLVANPAVGTGWEATYGIAFGLNAVYSYGLLSVGTFLLIRFAFTSQFLYQKQAAVLLAGIITPWFTDLMYITKLIAYDLTAIGFAVTGITFTWAVQRTKLFDVTPVARDSVIETLSSGVFVLDSKNRLVDSNAAGLALLNCSSVDIGRPIADLLEPFPVAAEQLKPILDSTEQQQIQLGLTDNYYEITVTPLSDDRGDLAGRVFLVHDITDQHHQRAQLKRQNDRLDQFAAVVSHDLRSPLSVASGYVELARKTGETDYFDEIEQSHQRMDQLIEELLTFARLDDAELETTAVDVESCAKAAWQHVNTADAELVVDCETKITANREHLLQLLENLIRNSVEHGGPAVTVQVAVETTESASSAQLRVSDDGRGIPADQKEAVLEEGYTTGSDGVGLGLAIVEGIANAHDWTVDVEDAEAGGAAFVFGGVDIDGETVARLRSSVNSSGH